MIWTADEEATLRRLVAEGLTYRAIGLALNRSESGVQYKAARLKLGPKPYTGNRSPIWSLILNVCADGQARTVHELATLTGASRTCIDHLMKTRLDAGKAHVPKWDRIPRGPAMPYWLPFPGKSAPRPLQRTAAERQNARMQRMREEDPLQYKAIVARCSVRRRIKAGKVTRQHPLIQALFGMGQQV